MNLETSVDASKIPFGLSLSKGERGFCGVTHWARSRKQFVLRQAQHERLSQTQQSRNQA
jgi:hypothetical protein